MKQKGAEGANEKEIKPAANPKKRKIDLSGSMLPSPKEDHVDY